MSEDIIIRASSLPTLLDCPRRWAARSLLELIGQTGYTVRQIGTHIGAPIGTGTHAAAASLLVAKRDGTGTTFAQARDAGIAALDEALASAGELSWDGTANNRDDAQRQVTRMSAVFAEQIVPVVEPLLVEENRFATIEPGFILKGQLDDLVTYSGKRRLRDTKTGSRPTGAISQCGAYSLLCESHGDKVEGLDIDFIARVPLKKAQPKAMTYTLDLPSAEAAAEEAITRAVSSVKRFRETGNPAAFPANPISKLCSAKFCPAHSSGFCKAHLPDGED